MHATGPIARRTFLADLGRGAFALAVVGIAGCGPSTLATFAPTPAGTAPGEPPTPGPTGGGATPPGASAPGGSGASWERVNLGFVSAYLLIRGGEAALVDTGVAGSGAAIEQALSGVSLGWGAVGHVILTHHHGDHQGSLPEVLAAAPDATAYAGAEDLAAINSPRPVTAVSDGADVFGLRIVTTPGHTAGSISVLDPLAGVLVAGDALGTNGGRPVLPGAQFTVDMDEAIRSIVKLGGLTFETLLVGHGEPIAEDAARAVAELGASS